MVSNRSFIALMGLFLIGFSGASTKHPLAYWMVIGKSRDKSRWIQPPPERVIDTTIHYELIINGHRTRVRTASNSVETPPTVGAHRTPQGVIYGNTYQVADGAYLLSEDQGFTYYRGKLKWIEGDDRSPVVFLNRVGEILLFVPEVDRMRGSATGHAVVSRLDKRWDIGIVRRALLQKDGSVVGWYPVVDGKPYTGNMQGDVSPAETPGWPVIFTKRYFRWKSGNRVESDSPLG